MTAAAPPAPAPDDLGTRADLVTISGYSSSITSLQRQVSKLANRRGLLLLELHEAGVHVDELAKALGGVTRATAYKLVRQAKTRRDEDLDTAPGMPVTSGA